MKDAQKEFKMNIQKHELTELGTTPLSVSFLISLLAVLLQLLCVLVHHVLSRCVSSHATVQELHGSNGQ